MLGDRAVLVQPDVVDDEDAIGVGLGSRWTAIEAVGLYVPGGTAAYPSSVLMNALPAKVAGVERLVMVVPTPDGKVNPLVFAAAHICGVSEVYRVGGAQAVGALAYGTETIKPVDKIVGPGNAYVAAAKRRVFGTVGIDMIAGPSEILVVADAENDPDWIAMDLLSQAEHDISAQSILITDDTVFADAVEAAVEAAKANASSLQEGVGTESAPAGVASTGQEDRFGKQTKWMRLMQPLLTEFPACVVWCVVHVRKSEKEKEEGA